LRASLLSRLRAQGTATWLVAIALLLSVWASTAELGAEAIEQAFQRALVGYAIARGLNGAISVAQGTEVAVQPAGVGVNFAPGEILDPINDLIERFSWIMMLSASSLGVQRVLLTMSGWWGALAVLALLGVGWLAVRVWRGDSASEAAGAAGRPGGTGLAATGLSGALGRTFLFLVVLRLAMPAVVLANEAVYRLFLASDYQAASVELERAREAIGAINEDVAAEKRPLTSGEAGPGLFDRARGAWQQAMQSIDIEARLDDYTRAAETVSENTIRLIVVFVMQTVVFPLLFLAVLWGVLKRLVRGP